jgi:hypothetical protein
LFSLPSFHNSATVNTNKGEQVMKAIIFTLALAMAVSGCATSKTWQATGGSRSDGVVRLSYEVGELERPMLDEQQAVDVATLRCKTWGYTGAEAFGGVIRRCNMGGGFGGCSRWLVTKEYQCTGTGSPTATSKQTN